MTVRGHFAALLAVGVTLVVTSVASAAFPNYSGCPSSNAEVTGCIDIQSTGGNLNIKEFIVPLGRSLEIRGGIIPNFEHPENPRFVPATGSNGFFATPVNVPGGLLGIEFPIPGNSVQAITELAGPSSSIHLNIVTQSIEMPVKVRLVNLLLGMDCHIGTNSRPVVLNLTTGTTSPPAPNRPISGHPGELSFEGEQIEQIFVRNILDVENSFAVPGATECGLGLGLINLLVNAKLRIPSAGGNNAIEVANEIAIRPTA